jgi:acyl-CoA synthetase (AMP-forming)/AMP-acid ligase II
VQIERHCLVIHTEFLMNCYTNRDQTRHHLKCSGRRDELSLRQVVSSGEPLHRSLLTALQRAWPGCRILNLYGCTESSGDSLSFDATNWYIPTSGPFGDSMSSAARPKRWGVFRQAKGREFDPSRFELFTLLT